eukprot:scaffold37660_cov32-Attheya_sp.AAC.2
MNLATHVAGDVTHSGIRVGCGIIKELGDGNGGVLGFLGRGDGSKGDQHGGIDRSGMVEEGANNFLEAQDAVGVEGGTDVFWNGELLGSTIDSVLVSMGRVLRSLSWSVLEAVQGTFNITGEGDITGASLVIPL